MLLATQINILSNKIFSNYIKSNKHYTETKLITFKKMFKKNVGNDIDIMLDRRNDKG